MTFLRDLFMQGHQPLLCQPYLASTPPILPMPRQPHTPLMPPALLMPHPVPFYLAMYEPTPILDAENEDNVDAEDEDSHRQ